MKKKNMFVLLLLMLALFITSCDLLDFAGDETTTDKTLLVAAIATADDLYDGTTVGTAVGEVADADANTYAAAITVAEAVADDEDADQDSIDEAIVTLASATTAFNDSIITEDPEVEDPEVEDPEEETVVSLISNGDFSSTTLEVDSQTTGVWSYYTSTGSTVSVIDGVLNYEITDLGGSQWENQLWQAGIVPTATTYEFSFDASSTVARDILFKLDLAGVAAAVYEFDFSLTDTMTTYTCEVTTFGVTDAATMKPLFAFGDYGTSSPSTITLDDIVLRELSASEIGPVITLTGDASVSLETGDTYTDEGATAIDNIDESVTVYTDNNVNANIAGTYTVVYSATDSDGNEATEVVRTVVVSDPVSESGWVYSTDGTPADDTSLTATVGADWGAGAVKDTAYSGDSAYDPCIQVTAGENAWGSGVYAAVLPITGMDSGVITGYSTLEFKLKYSDYTAITQVAVKMPSSTTEQIEFDIATYGSDLSNGWYQMSIPLSSFGTIPATISEFAILEFNDSFNGNPMYITDIVFIP